MSSRTITVLFGEWLSLRWVCNSTLTHILTNKKKTGDLLVSTGDDASIRTWKKAVSGNWAEYAEIETSRDR